MTRSPLLLRKWALLIAMAGLPGLAIASEQADRPEWNLEDSWSYVRTAHGTSRTTTTSKTDYTIIVTEKTPESYFTKYSGTDVDGKLQSSRLRWSSDTNFMNRGGEGGKWQEYPWYRWPLAEGGAWAGSWKFPTTDESLCQGRVRGWEQVTVPAGTFKTLRIEFSCGYYYHGVDGGSGRVTDSVWYSPVVKRHVRLERKNFKGPYVGTDDVEELTAYHVR